MQTGELIPVKIFCEGHNIEFAFITSLHETGLIELIVIDEISFFYEEQVEQLEKIVRLYYEMGINVEGIETINHLLQSINFMQQEIIRLKNRLQLYEEN